jgi:hypothetical protein
MPRGLEGISEEAQTQLAYFELRGVSAYTALLGRIAALLEPGGPLRERVLAAWADREFSAVYERPLLLCAALRFDALADPAHPLAPAIGAGPVIGPAEDGAVIASFTPAVLERLKNWLVQTNEVSRAIAWLLPLDLLRESEEVVLVDIGCSAGLNLVGDRVEQAWTDAAGAPLIPSPSRRIVRRLGLDRAPVDAADPVQAAWLRACVWPGQLDRQRRLEEALARVREARDAGELGLEALDAVEIPARLGRLAAEHPRATVLAYQSVVRQYLRKEARKTYEDGMRAWLRAEPRRAVWVELEASRDGRPGPAEIRAHAGEATYILASCDYHPATLVVRREACDAFRLHRA